MGSHAPRLAYFLLLMRTSVGAWVAVSARIAVAGCTITYRWHRPGITLEQFRLEEYECDRDAQRLPPAWWVWPANNAEAFYEKCMKAKGYERVRSGGYEAEFRIPAP